MIGAQGVDRNEDYGSLGRRDDDAEDPGGK